MRNGRQPNEALTSLLFSMGLSSIPDSITGIQITKTVAKEDWFLYNSDLENLSLFKVGPCMTYNLEEVIGKALSKHHRYNLERFLRKRKASPHDHTRAQYVAYMFYNDRLLAKPSTRTFNERMKASREQFRQAQLERKRRLAAFQELPGAAVDGFPCEVNDENVAPTTNASSLSSSPRKLKYRNT